MPSAYSIGVLGQDSGFPIALNDVECYSLPGQVVPQYSMLKCDLSIRSVEHKQWGSKIVSSRPARNLENISSSIYKI